MPPDVQFDENQGLGPISRPSFNRGSSSAGGLAGLVTKITGIQDPKTVNTILTGMMVVFFGVAVYFFFFRGGETATIPENLVSQPAEIPGGSF